MKKWALGCLGSIVSVLALIVAYFIFVPAPLFPILIFEARVNGLAEVKRTFPDQSFSWLDIFQSYIVFSWDGTDIVWHFDPPSQPFRVTAHCYEQDVWDGRGSDHVVKACLIADKRICDSGAHIQLYRASADGSLIVRRTTGNLKEYCLPQRRRPTARTS